VSIHPWNADHLFNWVWKTNKKFQQQKTTCGVKFSSFVSPKKDPCKNQTFTKRKKIVNPCRKNKSKLLASNPWLKKPKSLQQIQISCNTSLTKKNPNPSPKRIQILAKLSKFSFTMKSKSLQQIFHHRKIIADSMQIRGKFIADVVSIWVAKISGFFVCVCFHGDFCFFPDCWGDAVVSCEELRSFGVRSKRRVDNGRKQSKEIGENCGSQR